jgi:hypothetical protein
MVTFSVHTTGFERAVRLEDRDIGVLIDEDHFVA